MADDKKKRRSKYMSFAAKRKRGDKTIPTGRQGFLITCDGGREHQCARECVYLLDQYFDKLSSEIDAPSSEKEDEKAKESVSDGPQYEQKDEQKNNIEELLEAEIMELRDKSKTRFVNIETGCNGVVFVDMLRGSSVGPSELSESIVRTVAESKKSKTRFCMKFLPVEVTCYASAKDVTAAAEPLISKHFPAGESDDATGFKFAVVYESRANTGLDRMKLIDAVAKLVPKPHTVDLKAPQKAIIVQVVKTTCTIGVVNDYKHLAKYNLRQLLMQKQEEPENQEQDQQQEQDQEA